MLSPLNDGHVELLAKCQVKNKSRFFNPETKPKFWQEFTKKQIKKLFKTTKRTLAANGFGKIKQTRAWMLRYGRSQQFAYLRILELEGIGKRKLNAALDVISKDFETLDGVIIDIRNNPGGDDSTVLSIANRFCSHEMVAFHRKTKKGPGDKDFTPLKTWQVAPQGETQFTGPVVLLTCDAVFSGAEVFAMVMKQFPHVTIVGDHTNGIFSYQLEKKLPNGWRYSLSYQVYFSAGMVCYEAVGVPPDIELLNTQADLETGEDPLITAALEVLRSKSRQTPP